MQTVWLEDLVSLAKTRSFSQSAKLRQVTQPAFSRRIKALESWARTDLIDRSTFPPSLTAAGQTLYPQAIEILQALQTSRAMLRDYASNQDNVLDFAVPHTLALTFFPHWIIKQYELEKHVQNGYIYFELQRAVWGLPQAGILANKRLKQISATTLKT
jgi:DNA-binding transcriptional LysR family regulator